MYEDDMLNQGGLNNSSVLNGGSSEKVVSGGNAENSAEHVQNENYRAGVFSGYNSYLDAQNQSSPYNNNSQSNGGFTYGNYGYKQGNGYNQNSGYNQSNGYNQNSGYGYNNGSYSYNAGSTPTYGTYQYSNGGNDSQTGMDVPVKKKNTLGIAVAAIAILALLVCGIGGAYYTFANRYSDNDSEQEYAYDEQESQSSETTDNSTVKDNTQKPEQKAQVTTTTSETKAVVTDVTSVVAEVMPAMVIIHNNFTQSSNYFGYQQKEEATASGSGIIVGQNETELLIATNYHVIEGADSLEVIFDDEATLDAVVKGTNSDMDLAVIAVMLDDMSSSTINSIKVATLGNSEELVLGEPAIAIGNALGYGQSVTTGVISALNRSVEIEDGNTKEFIQTDAAINPGNSGGALLNLQGEVIGINSNKIGGETVEGMGYAIPISAAKPIIEQLMNEETKIKVAEENRGYIGISGVSVTSEVSAVYGLPQGVYVAEVTDGGGAEKAGIEKGDVIVGFEGYEITSMDDLQNRLQYYATGSTVTVEYMRQNGSEYISYTADVVLGGAFSGRNSSEDGNATGQYDGSSQVTPDMPKGRNGEGNSSGH